MPTAQVIFRNPQLQLQPLPNHRTYLLCTWLHSQNTGYYLTGWESCSPVISYCMPGGQGCTGSLTLQVLGRAGPGNQNPSVLSGLLHLAMQGCLHLRHVSECLEHVRKPTPLFMQSTPFRTLLLECKVTCNFTRSAPIFFGTPKLLNLYKSPNSSRNQKDEPQTLHHKALNLPHPPPSPYSLNWMYP